MWFHLTCLLPTIIKSRWSADINACRTIHHTYKNHGDPLLDNELAATIEKGKINWKVKIFLRLKVFKGLKGII